MLVPLMSSQPVELGAACVASVFNLSFWLQSTACRCGMAVPAAAASNASVWGVRTWVPLSLLQKAAAAAGMLPASSGGCGASSSLRSSSRSSCGETGDIESGGVAGGACPALMKHFALELQRQLSDPAGRINKQVTACHQLTMYLVTRRVPSSCLSPCSRTRSCISSKRCCQHAELPASSAQDPHQVTWHGAKQLFPNACLSQQQTLPPACKRGMVLCKPQRHHHLAHPLCQCSCITYHKLGVGHGALPASLDATF
jgi:hypothetical protein